MQSVWILIILIFLEINCQLSSAARLMGFTAGKNLVDHFRGGARGRPNKRRINNKPKKSRRIVENDDDDDDDEFFDIDDEDEYEDDRYSAGRSRGSKRKKSSSKKTSGYSLIPWGSGSKSKDSRRSSNSQSSFSIREKLEQIAKTGQSAYKDIYRRAKVFKSSAFEGILLKATWPTETPVPQEMLTDLIKYSIPAFKYTRSESEEDPYYMTLHKLWTKMTEKDWRTVVKSLYILHCISRDSSEESCRHFATAIKSLSKARNPKKPDQKYYDLRVISDVDANSQSYQPFIKAYAGYIIQRTKFFSGKFEEFNAYLSSSSSGDTASSSSTPKGRKQESSGGSILSVDAVKATLSPASLFQDTAAFQKFLTLLKRVEQLLKQGLQVRVTNKKQVNVVTGQIMKTMTQDLKDLWCLYDRLISTYLVSPSATSLSSTIETQAQSSENAKQIKEVLSFYQDQMENVDDYFVEHQKLFKSLKVKFVSPSPRQVQVELMKDRIGELVKLAGGAMTDADDDEEEYYEDEEDISDSEDTDNDDSEEEGDEDEANEDEEEKEDEEGKSVDDGEIREDEDEDEDDEEVDTDSQRSDSNEDDENEIEDDQDEEESNNKEEEEEEGDEDEDDQDMQDAEMSGEDEADSIIDDEEENSSDEYNDEDDEESEDDE